jgi:hypothetical protein
MHVGGSSLYATMRFSNDSRVARVMFVVKGKIIHPPLSSTDSNLYATLYANSEAFAVKEGGEGAQNAATRR